MGEIKTRQILLNLNFFWESEDININPSGWVLLKSELNGISTKESSLINLTYSNLNTSDSEITTVYNIDTFFSNTFTEYQYPTNSINLFALKYRPEEFNGNYSTFLDQYSLDTYNKINIPGIKVPKPTVKGKEYFNFQTNTLESKSYSISVKDLLAKQFTYKSYYNLDSNQYSDSLYKFTYGNYQNSDLDLILDKSNISDQLMVQLFKTPILKNVYLYNIPERNLVINGEEFTCKSGLIWKYKIAPVMPYGILESLAVEGEIDLMNIGIFSQNINKFKYYNIDFQSQLLVDMTSYNSQGHTVNTLKLTFYDLFGKVCDYVIPKMISYNGQFKVIVPLDGSLHDGMSACESYPNYFSTTLEEEDKEKGFIRLEDQDRYHYKDEKYVEELVRPKEGEDYSDRIPYYAYHDHALPEGLHPNYLYWVKVSYDLEENPGDFVEFPEGYWYWTNTKFNEYYYDNKYNNYNDIPFDLDLIVKASITGATPKTSLTEDDVDEKIIRSIYTEKNEPENCFKLKIYPDFLNYYKTLRVNTEDVSTFIASISYGVDSERAMWDRTQATVNIDDEKYDSPEYSYVNWSFINKFDSPSDDIISYYPTFNNTTDPVSFKSAYRIDADDSDPKKLTLKGVKYDDLVFGLLEDIKRTFEHQKVFENKTILYHPAKQLTFEHKFLKSGMHALTSEKPVCIVFMVDSEAELKNLDTKAKNADYLLDKVDNILAISEGGNKSVSCFLPKGATLHYYRSWFVVTGNTPLDVNKIFGEESSIGLLTVDGSIGDFQQNHLGNNSGGAGWLYNPDISRTWDSWINIRPYLKLEHKRRDVVYGMGTNLENADTFLFYRYGKDYYLFKIMGSLNTPFFDEKNSFYGIDESELFLGKTESVLSSYNLNTGVLINKQDLVINVEGKDNPEIYIGPFNVNLWKDIKDCNKEAKCILFSFNGIALTVLNLSINLKYPEKQIDDLSYYKDPDTEDILPYKGYTAFYKTDKNLSNNIPMYNASYDSERGLKVPSLLSDNSTKWGNGGCYMYYICQDYTSKGSEVLHLDDVCDNAMAGMLAVPFKLIKNYE